MNDLLLTNVPLDPANLITILVNLGLSFFFGALISWIYQRTHSGLSYSASLAFTIVFLTVVVSVAMMVIGNDLARAFGLLGAFSIIRFRTAIKDTKDIAYVFFALVIGMAVGTGSYTIAFVSTLMIGLMLYFLTTTHFGSRSHFDHIVNFLLDTEKASQDAYKSVFKTYFKNHSLLNVKAKRGGKQLEFVFNVRFIDEAKSGEFSEALSGIVGIEEVNLITNNQDVEY